MTTFMILAVVVVLLIVLMTVTQPAETPHMMVRIDTTVADDQSASTTFLPAGKMACKYIDSYKWRPVHHDNSPYVMFDAVNTFHRGDVLVAQPPPEIDADGVHHHQPWRPVGRVVSVMNINAFPVVVLDRPAAIGNHRVGVAPTPESAAAWLTTNYPDNIKSPVFEMTSLSRYQV